LDFDALPDDTRFNVVDAVSGVLGVITGLLFVGKTVTGCAAITADMVQGTREHYRARQRAIMHFDENRDDDPHFGFTVTEETVEGSMETALHTDDCAVCLRDLSLTTERVAVLPCNHVYHPSCISPWFNVNSSCPECRAPVRNRKEVQLKWWRFPKHLCTDASAEVVAPPTEPLESMTPPRLLAVAV
jgi:hypothetical protein